MAYRDCFMVPPVQTAAVVGLFDSAADALLKDDERLADDLIARADMASLYEHSVMFWGPNNEDFHRWSASETYKTRMGNPVPKDQRDKPKPSVALKREVFARDGWHCVYCGIPVIAEPAFKKLRSYGLPSLRWGDQNADLHTGAVLIWGVLDHLLPLSAGGRTDADNLVSACWLCNAAKWNATLDEAELNDPRSRVPNRSDWDGLMRLLG